MHHISEFLNPGIVAYPVKQKTMSQVFKECPEEYTRQEDQCDPEKRIFQFAVAEVQHVNDDGQIDAPDHEGMCLGQHFQVLIPE